MKFKQWLLKEDFGNIDNSQNAELFIPTNAGDYAYAASDPGDHFWLQWKWSQEFDNGRKFHNIDTKEFQKRHYVNIESLTMPKDRWIHKSDKSENIKVSKLDRFIPLGISRDSNNHLEIPQKSMIQGYLDLDKMFKDSGSGKWQSEASDKRWKQS